MLDYRDDLLANENIKSLFGDDLNYIINGIMSCAYSGIILGSLKDPNKPFALWNRRATEILGQGPKETPYTNWTQAYGLKNPVTKEPLPNEEIPLVMAFNGKSVHEKIIIVTNDIQEVYISCNAMPLIQANKIVGGVVVFADVTQTIQEKEKLKKEIVTLTHLNNEFKKKS